MDVEGQLAVVVGGGKVALRKTRGLLEAGALVTVVSPQFKPEFDTLNIQRIEREFADEDVNGARLLFAATNIREVNHRVYECGRMLGIPVNIADAPEECGFIVPARIRENGLLIAISTGGTDPARAASVRVKLEECLKLMRP